MPPVDVKPNYSTSSLPFGKILVESTLDASKFKNNGTIKCDASNDVATSSTFFNFAIKGMGQRTWRAFDALICSAVPPNWQHDINPGSPAAASLVCVVCYLSFVEMYTESSLEQGPAV